MPFPSRSQSHTRYPPPISHNPASMNNRIDFVIAIVLQKTEDKILYLFDNDTGKTGNNIYTIGKYDIEDNKLKFD